MKRQTDNIKGVGGSKASWRQRLRQWSSRHPSQVPSSTVPPSNVVTTQFTAATTAQNVVNHTQPFQSSSTSSAPFSTLTSTRLLQNALQCLNDDDRTTIERYLPSTSNDIQSAVQKTITAAQVQRQACLDKRWKFTFGGRDVILREKADTVIHWLNRFKPVGDVAANADPVHVGLPWAGVRLLLEVVVTDSNQMTALLTGCETALYMTSRLNVYVEFWYGLPSHIARNDLEESITIMYTCILRFLAQAIQIYQTPTVQRTLAALWDISDVVSFETKVEGLAVKVERDANNCSRALGNQDQQTALQLQRHMHQVLVDLQDHHSRLQSSLDRLQLRINLDKIPYASGAIFNSSDSVHALCHPATRHDILSQVKTWAQQPQGKSIFWLYGGAGAGKSTISWTISQWLTGLADIGLGASFFFKRGESDRGSARRFFPTIIRQLITKISGLDVLVAEAINTDPLIFDKAPAEQFRRLILHPLQNLSVSSSQLSTTVVVVDALDECEKENDIKIILELWLQLSKVTCAHLRLFLTSRPELPIRLGFQQMSKDRFQDINLVDAVPSDTIRYDLSVYLNDSLCSVRQNYNHRFLGTSILTDSWPESATIERLVDIASPLFIVAATICRLIGDLDFDPQESLESILRNSDIGQLSQWELTYLPVLNHLTTKTRNQEQKDKLYDEFRAVVGSIILLTEPLSANSLAILIGESIQLINRQLARLHSVLCIPADRNVPIRTLHLSFAEFLLSEQAQKQPFGINEPNNHFALSTYCLKVLSGPDGLRDNICEFNYPGQPRYEIDSTVVQRYLPPVMQYACRHWVYHITHSGCQLKDDGKVHMFFKKHFLHWLEALSIIGHISETVAWLGQLRSCVLESAFNLSAFLEDARRFILAHIHIIDLAPLQLYSSAIIFTPEKSLVRQTRGRETRDQVPFWIRQHPRTTTEWGLELQKLEGHSTWVTSVAFSPDGTLLASGSNDQTVRLWNVQTGTEVQKLEGHSDGVTSMAFSPDGTLLASGSYDQTVRLWDVQTRRKVQTLLGITTFNTLSFADSTILLTDIGMVRIGDSTVVSASGIQNSPRAITSISGGWIQQNKQNLLWLPHEYRGREAAFNDTKLAIGASSGLVMTECCAGLRLYMAKEITDHFMSIYA